MQWAADKYGMPKPGSSDDSDLPLIMDELYARATGKIVLANLGLDDLDHYFLSLDPIKLTPYTLVDIDEIRKDILNTRTRGYSINDKEYMTGVISIGAPIMNLQTKSVVGAVSLDFPSKDYSLDDIENSIFPCCSPWPRKPRT